jgi:CDP-6-deoxy-D-xylo-4-hexulose-3-dehydrase
MDVPQGANPAYFGFPLVLSEDQPAGLRDKFVEHLENNGVHVRLFFAGNLLRHTPYKNLKYKSKSLYNNFPIADYLMKNALFCGCWPGLTLDDMDYVAKVIKDFF